MSALHRRARHEAEGAAAERSGTIIRGVVSGNRAAMESFVGSTRDTELPAIKILPRTTVTVKRRLR